MHLLPGSKNYEAVEIVEAYADGRATGEELSAAYARHYLNFRNAMPQDEEPVYYAVHDLAELSVGFNVNYVWMGLRNTLGEGEGLAQCHLLRDLFGHLPFRPVVLDPAWLSWYGGSVVRLAKLIYDERKFEWLPELAEALEAAGCRDAELLGHLRSPGPHCRGCWPLDLVLARR